MHITIEKVDLDYDPMFSILIPSWNNIEYLKCVINSIEKNSFYRHQILVHINEGIDGTEQWVKDKKNIGYTKSNKNIGVCLAFNTVSHLVSTEYIVLLDDDLYLCPNWDKYLYDDISSQTGTDWCVSATMIDPRNLKNKCMICNADYGRSPSQFDEKKFLSEYEEFPKNDWNGTNWYPMVLPTIAFKAVGGLSIEYSPGIGSDPDFMVKLWIYGIRYFKGISKSRAYHFGSITTTRVHQNDGRSMFIHKWGMTIRSFSSHYLKIGSDFKGYLPNIHDSYLFRMRRWFDRRKSHSQCDNSLMDKWHI